MAMNFDYLTASNRLLEITIESEEIKGQLQVIDRQIAKCMEMRMDFLSRQQSMDAERLALVNVSRPPSPNGLAQQQQQQHQDPNLQNTDATSSSIDYSALDKYSLPSPTKRKPATTKPRVRKNAGVTSTPKNKSSAATKVAAEKKKSVDTKVAAEKKKSVDTKVAAEKKKSVDTKVTAKKKKVTPKKPTEKPKEVAVASSTRTSKVKVVVVDLVTEPVDLAADHSLTLPTPGNKTLGPPMRIQENNEVLDARRVSPTNEDSYLSIFKPNNAFQIGVPRATCRFPLQSTTNTTTISSVLSNSSFKPPQSTRTITSEQVTKAPAISSTIYPTHRKREVSAKLECDNIKRKAPLAPSQDESAGDKKLRVEERPTDLICLEGPAISSTIYPTRRQREVSAKLECDNMKRKAPLAPSQDESAGDKKPRVEQRPTDLICLEGKPRRVFFYGHRKAVTALKVYGDNVFSCSVDDDHGSIKRYSPLTDSERLMDGRLQLAYNHEYIHNARDVCGLELFVTKQATYIIVGITDGTLKMFSIDSKWPNLTVSIKEAITCLALKWNALFVGTGAGKVLRFSAMKLKLESTLPCSYDPITCLGTAKDIARRILITCSLGGDVNIRDAFSGLFKRSLKLRPNRYPIDLMIVQDRVYTRAAMKWSIHHYEIYVHNVGNGNRLHLIEGPSGISSFFVSLTDPDNVYFTNKYGTVYQYSCDGGIPVKLDCGLNAGEPSALCLHKNMIIVGSHQGELQAFFYEVK